MINIERTKNGAVTILRLEGDIDEQGMNQLRLALTECIHDERYRLVVNMAEVRFVSYMGVGVLVERLRQVHANQGSLKLVGVNMYTQRLFRMVGVSRILECYDTENQAVQACQAAA